MATKPENPSPIFNLPVFIPENWTSTSLTSSTSTSVVNTSIVGEIIAYQGTSLPSANWLWCDGASYATSLYSDLYAVIGTNYGSSSVANPASSSVVNIPNQNYSPKLDTTQLSPSGSTINQSSAALYFWSIVIPSNTSSGSPNNFKISSPIGADGTGSFSPFGFSTLFITLQLDNVGYEVYKDGVLFDTGTAIAEAGSVSNIIFSVENTSITTTWTMESPFGNYYFYFTPDIQATSSTYTMRYIISYSSVGAYSGMSTTWSNSFGMEINLTNLVRSITPSSGTAGFTTQAATGLSTASATWNGASLFAVPDLRSKTPVGSDATNIYTTSYGGSSVSSGGNKTMSGNQLATHSHSISISPTTPMLQSFTQNNAIQGIAAGSGDIVKTALYGQDNFTGTAGNAGSGADLLPPFNVSNFVIRAN